MLKFITSNKTKAKEAAQILAPFKIEQLNMDLPEIQELDVKKVLKHKLNEALKHRAENFFVEDSALYFDCLKGKLPGPLIKWFNETLGSQGEYVLAKKLGNTRAVAKTLIAYCQNKEKIYYFEGAVKGKIVKPRGKYSFGYDEIFLPSGSKKTLSEIKAEGIFTTSPRGLAFKKFKQFLIKSKNETR